MTLRSLASRPTRSAARVFVSARTRGWSEDSRLFAVGERTGWSVDDDARHLEDTARRLGYTVAPARWARFTRDQSVFLTSHFEAMQPRWTETSHRLATAYLHGRPGTSGYPEFDRAYERLAAFPYRFARVQVTHGEMRDLVVAAGVPPHAVHVIPIGIDIEHFPLVSGEARAAARSGLDLAESAFVVGSFQKDGIGWGDGLEPKLIKGPDVLVGAMERVHTVVPELHVVLTGPARGYVRHELERRGIAYRHILAQSRRELASAFHAVDVCVVASRQEGGPKAALESMASGIPLVTTRVGQATELVEHERTGWLVDVDDVEGLAHWTIEVQEGGIAEVVSAARIAAERHALVRLDPLWSELLDGFVERRPS